MPSHKVQSEMRYPLIRVRTENGWEVWSNIKEVNIPHPQRVPFLWHMDEHFKVIIDEWITIPADLPTVTTTEDIDIRVLELEVLYE